LWEHDNDGFWNLNPSGDNEKMWDKYKIPLSLFFNEDYKSFSWNVDGTGLLLNFRIVRIR